MVFGYKKATSNTATEITPPQVGLLIGFVDFKVCVEQSRLGKEERAAFEEMKKTMNVSLQEKQQLIQEINAKLNDPAYINSLTKKADAELKLQFRMVSQELAQQEEQCYHLLEQHNAKAMQKLHDLTKKAAEMVAKQEGLLMIINRDAVFYYAPEQDKTELVLAQLNKLSFDS